MTSQAVESDALLITHRQTSYSTVSTIAPSDSPTRADVAVSGNAKVDTGDVDKSYFSWSKLWKYTGPGRNSCSAPYGLHGAKSVRLLLILTLNNTQLILFLLILSQLPQCVMKRIGWLM
jgi:hypothetical protein